MQFFLFNEKFNALSQFNKSYPLPPIITPSYTSFSCTDDPKSQVVSCSNKHFLFNTSIIVLTIKNFLYFKWFCVSSMWNLFDKSSFSYEFDSVSWNRSKEIKKRKKIRCNKVLQEAEREKRAMGFCIRGACVFAKRARREKKDGGFLQERERKRRLSWKGRRRSVELSLL